MTATINQDDRIVVVSGLPRSGTSMLMQMLVAGGFEALTDDKRSADEDNPAGYFEHQRIMGLQKDNSWLAEARGKVIKVVAPLLNFLPPEHDYRIVFVLRDVDEVVQSQQKMLDRLGQKGATMSPAMLAKQFAALLDRARTQLQAKYPEDVLFLEHRDCIREPAETAAQVQAFLGDQLDAAAMAAAVRPNLYRNRT